MVQRLEGGRRASGYVREKRPLVTVVIVVRNNRKDIEKALESVFPQDKDICELIVVDGASTDGTLDILRKHDGNIDYWMSEADKGIYDAMNKAVQRALGWYVYFLGSDDLLTIDLTDLASVLTDPSTVYYGNIRSPSSGSYDGPFNAWKLAKQPISQQAIFYPIGAFRSEGFRINYKVFGDVVFNWRCFADKRLRFQYIPYVIAYYSDSGISSRDLSDPPFERDRLPLIRKYLPLPVYLYEQTKASVRSRLKFL